MITTKMELYAAEIFRLQETYEFVPLSALAEVMSVSLQAASGMITRLTRDHMIEHEPYKGVRLSESGEKVALLAIRRHRIAEAYLVNIMGFGWDEAHALTDHFHMGITQLIEDRMNEIAGKPERCPHGEPIPSKAGIMPRLNDASLVTFQPECLVRISRVRAHDPAKLQYFAALDLRPAREIRLLSQSPFNGPVRIRTGSQEHVLGHDLASTLWVEAL